MCQRGVGTAAIPSGAPARDCSGVGRICEATALMLGIQSRLLSPSAHFLPRFPRGVPCRQPQLSRLESCNSEPYPTLPRAIPVVLCTLHRADKTIKTRGSKSQSSIIFICRSKSNTSPKEFPFFPSPHTTAPPHPPNPPDPAVRLPSLQTQPTAFVGSLQEGYSLQPSRTLAQSFRHSLFPFAQVGHFNQNGVIPASSHFPSTPASPSTRHSRLSAAGLSDCHKISKQTACLGIVLRRR